jgi:hypothetical protein
MAKVRRQFAGGAVASTLTGSIAASGVTTFSIAASTNWSTSTTIPFYVVLSPQTSSEEKMLVTLSSNTLTIVSRGIDGTSASSHASGATIYPVFTAIDANEANELTAKYANRGSIVYQGASTFEELVKGTQGHPLVIGANDPAWGQVGTVGIADSAITTGKINNSAVTTDKINDAAVTAAKLASQVAGSGLVGGAGDALAVNVDDSTIEIQSDAVRVKDLGVTTAKINNLAVTAGKLADDSVTNDKIDYATVPQTTVATGDPTGGKNGDIWVKVIVP